MEDGELFGVADGCDRVGEIRVVAVLRYLRAGYGCLVGSLFEERVNGVNACWLYGKFGWEMVYVDAYFPYDEQLNPLYASTTD